MTNGYIILSRSIFESKIWTESHDIKVLWIYLIGKARHKTNPVKLANVTIKRGELVTSYANIAEDNQWSYNNQIKMWNKTQIHRMLNKLVDGGYIKILNDTYGTHIKICNYDIYQNPITYKKYTCNSYETDVNNYDNDTYDDTKSDTCNDNETACVQLVNGLCTACETNNNDKNDKNGKNDKQIYIGVLKNSDNGNGKKKKVNKYEGIDNIEIIKLLDEYVKMRKSIKKPMTDNAIKRLIKKLKGLSQDDNEQIKILEQSIDHCWQSVFPLKNNSKKSMLENRMKEWDEHCKKFGVN